jgi:hypothetical protein
LFFKSPRPKPSLANNLYSGVGCSEWLGRIYCFGKFGNKFITKSVNHLHYIIFLKPS